jgi:hypothetical protein
MKLYFFKCSVSEDLYGTSPNKNGEPLPTPGGGTWLPIEIINSEHSASIIGFDKNTANSKLKNGVATGLLRKDQEISFGERMDLLKKKNNAENYNKPAYNNKYSTCALHYQELRVGESLRSPIFFW